MPSLQQTTGLSPRLILGLLAVVVFPCALAAQQTAPLEHLNRPLRPRPLGGDSGSPPERRYPQRLGEGAPKTVAMLHPANASMPKPPSLDWWSEQVTRSVLDHSPRWVTFDLETILLDTLSSSPRIQGVSRSASISLEKIIQQDAAFDPRVLFDSEARRINDPVGNSLATGGPPRLIEESITSSGGISRTTRRGGVLDASQEIGFLDSNSKFFAPSDQSNSRLSLSLTQPLLDRGGRLYNERLLTQARIDSRVSWQEMRGEVEKRIAEVIQAYWRLYELRCHLLQQRSLLERARRIESLLEARRHFDAGRIELAKARQRVARRSDQLVQLEAEVAIQQVRLANLVGSDAIAGAESALELIPLQSPDFPDIEIELRDALMQGIENRPEVRAAVAELEAAALSVQVTRTELLPQLTAVVETYVSGLNGDYQAGNSFADQFTTGGPGLSGGLQYEMPYGRRAARSRHREAHFRYEQRSEQVREAMQVTRAEIQSALINVERAMQQRRTKHRLLETAIEEETVLTQRWEMMSTDDGHIGTVLETLLDAQQRRTDAEREWISARSTYVAALIELQRAMGTLLIRKGIQPVKSGGTSVEFIQQSLPPDPSELAPTAPVPKHRPTDATPTELTSLQEDPSHE